MIKRIRSPYLQGEAEIIWDLLLFVKRTTGVRGRLPDLRKVSDDGYKGKKFSYHTVMGGCHTMKLIGVGSG